jgi:flagellar biosynthesis/type III secretory pathway chaperone
MSEKPDTSIMGRIEALVAEEQQLYQKGQPSEEELAHLMKIKVELDQCWDLLRQRRALREFGKDPGEAELRPPGVVEKYIG